MVGRAKNLNLMEGLFRFRMSLEQSVSLRHHEAFAQQEDVRRGLVGP